MAVKEKLLSIFEKEKGITLSGEDLAGMLGVSRAAVWKAISQLKQEGHRIESIASKGYRMEKDNDILSKEGIYLYLAESRTKIDGFKVDNNITDKNYPGIFIYDKVDSTNTAAKQIAMEGGSHGTLVLAEEQTTGKGRLGRSFHSPKGKGLYMSILLKPKFDLSKSLLITTCASVAVSRAIKAVYGVDVGIKWVNDLYLKEAGSYRGTEWKSGTELSSRSSPHESKSFGKKVCGILTEAVTDLESGEIESIILGIGINCTAAEEDFPPSLRGVAGSLKGDDFAGRNRLAAEVWMGTMEMMEIISTGSAEVAKPETDVADNTGFDARIALDTELDIEAERETLHSLMEEYKNRSVILGKEIYIYPKAMGGQGPGMDKDGKQLEGKPAKAIDITPEGGLLVGYSDGEQEILTTGEISIRLK